MSAPLKVGLAGTGSISWYHLPAYQQFPETVKLTAVCDIRPEAMEKFGEKAGVKDRYTDFNEMLKKADIDAVDICTIHDQHEAQVLAAAAAGKQIFLEKPMAVNIKQCYRMVEAAKKAGVTFMVGHDLRYMPHALAIKRAVDSGELGPVRMTRSVLIANMDFGAGGGGFKLGHWLTDPKRSGGGMVISGLIHQIDLLRYYIGDIKNVYAINRSHQSNAEEYTTATLEFENGVIGTAIVIGPATRSPLGCEYTIFGDDGTIISTQAENRTYQFGHGTIASKKRGNAGETFNKFAPIEPVRGNLHTDDPFINEILHFADCCREKKEPLTSGRDNLGTIKTVFAIYESIKTGKKIELAKM